MPIDYPNWLVYVLIAIIVILSIFLIFALLYNVGIHDHHASIAFDYSAYSINNAAMLTVIDDNANTNPFSRETITVHVTSPSDTSGFDIQLEEYRANSDKFVSHPLMLQFTTGPSDSSVAALQVSPGQVVNATYGGITAQANVYDSTFANPIGAWSTDPFTGTTPSGGTYPTIGQPVDLEPRLSCFDDLDGDALCDEWEQSDGLRIDYNAASYWLDCSTDTVGCADPYQKDIFVELDFMLAAGSSQRPTDAAIAAVVQRFTDHGIRLHVQIDEDGIGFADTIMVPGDPNLSAVTGPPNFYSLKLVNFGTVSEITEGTNQGALSDYLTAKRQGFHYAMFITRQQGNELSSGYGEMYGNDMVISLGSFTNGVGTVDEQAGTFMHELGHNLGLYHGGGLPPDYDGGGLSTDNFNADNCKPNYRSVMSYTFQFPYFAIDSPLDYSSGNLIPLDEGGGLVDSNGIGMDGTSITAYGVINSATGSRTIEDAPKSGVGRAIDWDGNGNPTGNIANVNNLSGPNLPVVGCDVAVTTILTDHNDWSNLRYDFRSSSQFLPGIGTSPSALNEITLDTLNNMLYLRHGQNYTDFIDAARSGMSPWSVYYPHP